MKKAFSVFLSCSIALASVSTYSLDVIAVREDSSDHTIDTQSYGEADNLEANSEIGAFSNHDISKTNFTSIVDGVPISLRGVNVNFNGERLQSDFPAVMYRNRTMVPLRAISENMGAEVNWIDDEKAITIELGQKKIRLQIDNSTVNINGSEKGIAYNVPPKLMRETNSSNSTTMVPLRFISEELGAVVNWNEDTFTADIDHSSKGISPTDSLLELKLEQVNGKDAIAIYTEGSTSPEYIKKLLNNPKRLVLDLKDTVLKTSDLRNLESTTISSVRTSQYYNSKEYREDELITRVVLDIDSRVVDYSHDIRVEGNKITVIVENNSLSMGPPPESKPDLGEGNQNNSGNNNGSSRVTYTDYGISLDEMVRAQSQRLALTDSYRNSPAYIFSGDISTTDGRTGRVSVDHASVRESATAMAFKFGSLNRNTPVTIVGKSGDWYQISYSTWRNAKPNDIRYYLDPNNFSLDSVGGFQFLDLSKTSNVSASDLNNNILKGKGILENQGNTFIEAGRRHGVNEVYLVSHALLETGNGKSQLATGVLVSSVDGKSVTPRVVYNMFGIGAADTAPLRLGSERAYKEGWFTPEQSIMGGAKFIGEKYINRPNNRQNTLYKMRWNPDQKFIWHQYATDIGWAFKQTANMKRLYDLCSNYELVYDIPRYR